MDQAFKNMGFSMRTYYKLLKVARTIADIEAAEASLSHDSCGTSSAAYDPGDSAGLIQLRHVAEAMRYRELDDFYRRGADGR